MDKARLGFIIAFLGSISYFAYENEQLLKEISPVVSDEDATYKKRIEEIADKYNLDLEQKGRKRKFDFDAGHSFHSKEK